MCIKHILSVWHFARQGKTNMVLMLSGLAGKIKKEKKFSLQQQGNIIKCNNICLYGQAPCSRSTF